jgi:hypothetical protein
MGASWPHVVSPVISFFFVRARRTLRMVGCVLHAFCDRRFDGLIVSGELFHAGPVFAFNLRQPLEIAGLARAVWSHLGRIIPYFIRSNFIVKLSIFASSSGRTPSHKSSTGN